MKPCGIVAVKPDDPEHGQCQNDVIYGDIWHKSYVYNVRIGSRGKGVINYL